MLQSRLGQPDVPGQRAFDPGAGRVATAPPKIAVYAPYEPNYLSDAAAVIEDVFQRLGRLTKAGLIGKSKAVVGGSAIMTVPTGKAIRRGVGEIKRTEARRLSLEGVPPPRNPRAHRLVGRDGLLYPEGDGEEQAILRSSR